MIKINTSNYTTNKQKKPKNKNLKFNGLKINNLLKNDTSIRFLLNKLPKRRLETEEYRGDLTKTVACLSFTRSSCLGG